MTIAPTPPVLRPRRRKNRWVEDVWSSWRAAMDAWEKQAETVAIGYDTELADFEREHPKPRFRDFMVHMSQKEVT